MGKNGTFRHIMTNEDSLSTQSVNANEIEVKTRANFQILKNRVTRYGKTKQNETKIKSEFRICRQFQI